MSPFYQYSVLNTCPGSLTSSAKRSTCQKYVRLPKERIVLHNLPINYVCQIHTANGLKGVVGVLVGIWGIGVVEPVGVAGVVWLLRTETSNKKNKNNSTFY